MHPFTFLHLCEENGKIQQHFPISPWRPPGHFNPLKLNPSKNSQKIRIYFGAKMFINP